MSCQGNKCAYGGTIGCGYPPCGGCCACLGGCVDEAEFQMMEDEIENAIANQIEVYGIPGMATESTAKEQLTAYRAAIERRTRLACVIEIAAIRDAPGNGTDTYLIYSQAMDEIHPDEES